MILGYVPLSPEAIVKTLRDQVPKAAKRVGRGRPSLPEDGNTVWTLAVKSVLAALAESYGGHSICTDKKARKTEFMLDFVWWDRSARGERAVLGCESEWGNPRNKGDRHNAVAAEFEKLLSFKAPLKLLLFEAPDAAMRRRIRSEIRRYGTNFAQHVRGECYMFVEFSQGKCLSHIYRVRKSGKVRDFNPFD